MQWERAAHILPREGSHSEGRPHGVGNHGNHRTPQTGEIVDFHSFNYKDSKRPSRSYLLWGKPFDNIRNWQLHFQYCSYRDLMALWMNVNPGWLITIWSATHVRAELHAIRLTPICWWSLQLSVICALLMLAPWLLPYRSRSRLLVERENIDQNTCCKHRLLGHLLLKFESSESEQRPREKNKPKGASKARHYDVHCGLEGAKGSTDGWPSMRQ